MIKLKVAFHRVADDPGVVFGRARITGQGAVSPTGIENRRIARIFQGAMGAVSLIGRHLGQALIAARIAGGMQFIDQGVVKPRLRQPRLVRKESVYELHQARFIFPFELLLGHKNLVGGKKGGSGVGFGQFTAIYQNFFLLRISTPSRSPFAAIGQVWDPRGSLSATGPGLDSSVLQFRGPNG